MLTHCLFMFPILAPQFTDVHAKRLNNTTLYFIFCDFGDPADHNILVVLVIKNDVNMLSLVLTCFALILTSPIKTFGKIE